MTQRGWDLELVLSLYIKIKFIPAKIKELRFPEQVITVVADAVKTVKHDLVVDALALEVVEGATRNVVLALASGQRGAG